ncbi:methyl-accepting chemotaxis protein signaling domain protein [Clostridiales bacterium oral taxon 876 str. F0540]|nr:methyl-accepting chemotaxis protein signaling domain protein [Clostridiales bacterium oral taxon 876 str. F0540]
MKSIKSKLTLFFSGLLVVGSLGFGIVSYKAASNALVSNVNKTIPKMADEGAKMVEGRLQSQLESLSAIAENDTIKNRSTSVSKQAEVLNAEKKRKNYIHLFVIDKDGKALLEDGSSLDLKDREYFKKAIAGERNVSDPIVSKAKDGSNLIISFAVPIKNNNEVVGVLAATQDGNLLSELTNDITFGKTGKAFMLRKDGTTIAHTNKDLVLNMDNDFENVKKDSKLKSLVEIEKKMVAGEAGTGEYVYDGVSKYVGYAPVKGTEWSLAVVIAKNEVLSETASLKNSIIIIALVFIAVGIAFAQIISSKIVKGITGTSQYLELLSGGDFSKNVPEKYINMKDEVGLISRSTQKLTESIREMIKQIKESSSSIETHAVNLSSVSEEISTSSQSVASSIQDVAQGTSTQAEDLVDITGILNQFSENLQAIVDEIKAIDVSAKEVGNMSEESNSKMEALMASVNKINKSFGDFISRIQGLEQNVSEINQIINIINSIADQTNLLALNAAIEAARVGEAGRGFAVVAEEIRNLAEQSKTSSETIANLILDVSNSTSSMVNTTEELNDELKGQLEIINNTLMSFKKITSGINEVVPKIERVNSSAVMIDEDKTYILEKIESVSAIAQETSASSEEIAASAEEMNASTEEVAASAEVLSEMTKEMMKQVNKFEL